MKTIKNLSAKAIAAQIYRPRSRQIKNRLLLAGITISLLACSIWSPEYSKPQLALPQGWSRFESVPLNAESNLAYTAWWQKFNDPQLNQLILAALANNNSIQQAQGNLEAARGQLKAVELSWIPSISTFAGYSSNPAFGLPLGFFGVWPQYAAFNIFNTISQQKSAKIAVTLEEQALAATKLVLIGQVANSYFTLIAEREQLKLFKAYEKDLSEVLAIQKADYQGGISSEIEVKGIAQRVNLARREENTIENNLVKSQNALHYLLNQYPAELKTQTDFSKFNTTYPTFANLPTTVIANRPDVAITELRYRLAIQNKGNAYSQFLPAVQLDSFQGHSDVGSNGSPALGVPVTMNDAYLNWTINPAVFGQIDAYNGLQKTTYYAYIDTVKKALRDVDNDLVTHQLANARYNDTFKAYQDSLQKYQLTANLYQTGIAPYLSSLKDRLDQDQMAIELNQIKLVQMLAIVNIYQDLGGGYKYTESK